MTHQKLLDKYDSWLALDNVNYYQTKFKGGVRFNENVSAEEVVKLASTMTQKCKYYNLPFNGAKAGVKVNPDDLSADEKEELARAFARAYKFFIGRWSYITAPDMGTGPREMDAIADELKDFAVCTGKSIKIGGLDGRDQATGYGGYIQLRKLPVRTIAIQGNGNVGSWLKHFIEISGDQLFNVVNQTDIHSGKKENKELLESDVDCLILAACENQINTSNYKKIKAKYIIEMANGGIDPELKYYLRDAGIIIIDDYICNAGGVIASYLEWKQNTNQGFYSKEDVFKFIKDKMKVGQDE